MCAEANKCKQTAHTNFTSNDPVSAPRTYFLISAVDSELSTCMIALNSRHLSASSLDLSKRSMIVCKDVLDGRQNKLPGHYSATTGPFEILTSAQCSLSPLPVCYCESGLNRRNLATCRPSGQTIDPRQRIDSRDTLK